jgi:hypothetical protein
MPRQPAGAQRLRHADRRVGPEHPAGEPGRDEGGERERPRQQQRLAAAHCQQHPIILPLAAGLAEPFGEIGADRTVRCLGFDGRQRRLPCHST